MVTSEPREQVLRQPWCDRYIKGGMTQQLHGLFLKYTLKLILVANLFPVQSEAH